MPNVEVYLDGIILEQMNHINHLGHILSQNLSDDKDILLQISMYNRKANTVLLDFRGISGEYYEIVLQFFLWIATVGSI